MPLLLILPVSVLYGEMSYKCGLANGGCSSFSVALKSSSNHLLFWAALTLLHNVSKAPWSGCLTIQQRKSIQPWRKTLKIEKNGDTGVWNLSLDTAHDEGKVLNASNISVFLSIFIQSMTVPFFFCFVLHFEGFWLSNFHAHMYIKTREANILIFLGNSLDSYSILFVMNSLALCYSNY